MVDLTVSDHPSWPLTEVIRSPYPRERSLISTLISNAVLFRHIARDWSHPVDAELPYFKPIYCYHWRKLTTMILQRKLHCMFTLKLLNSIVKTNILSYYISRWANSSTIGSMNEQWVQLYKSQFKIKFFFRKKTITSMSVFCVWLHPAVTEPLKLEYYNCSGDDQGYLRLGYTHWESSVVLCFFVFDQLNTVDKN